jgi:hypothetical protein
MTKNVSHPCRPPVLPQFQRKWHASRQSLLKQFGIAQWQQPRARPRVWPRRRSSTRPGAATRRAPRYRRRRRCPRHRAAASPSRAPRRRHGTVVGRAYLRGVMVEKGPTPGGPGGLVTRSNGHSSPSSVPIARARPRARLLRQSGVHPVSAVRSRMLVNSSNLTSSPSTRKRHLQPKFIRPDRWPPVGDHILAEGVAGGFFDAMTVI